MRAALGNSYNIPAVKALEHAGLGRLKDGTRRAGITTLTRPDYGLALTLGGGEVTLLELTGAYGTLANGGARPGQPGGLRAGCRGEADLAGCRGERRIGLHVWAARFRER